VLHTTHIPFMPQLPPVTKALLLICTAIFCVQQLVGLGLLALWPLGSGQFMPWQILTYAFLHGDVMHLFFNMFGLWMFGAEIEMVWGRKRYIHFLLASVVAGAAGKHHAEGEQQPSVPRRGFMACCSPSA
jgi:membrane associated rhomboid family serine protease